MRPDHSLRRTLDETHRLIETAHRLFDRNLEVYRDAVATFQRLRVHVAEARERMQHQGPRRIARLRRLLVIARMEEGRLPDTMPSIVSGEPGFGSECDACSGYMPATQVMMMIPNGDAFAYVHADCYVIWVAQCRLSAALRRIA